MREVEETGSVDSIFWDDLEIGEEDEAQFMALTNAAGPSKASSWSQKGRKGKTLMFSASCSKCNRKLSTFEGYKDHLKMHGVEEMYHTAPGLNTVLAEFKDKSRGVLTEISSYSTSHGISQDVVSLSRSILPLSDDTWFNFVECIVRELWACIPAPASISLSTFHTTYTACIIQMVTDKEKRAPIMECLNDILPSQFSERVKQWFLWKFVFKLAVAVEAYYLNSMREAHEVFLYGAPVALVISSKDDPEDLEFQQSVFYIGGSAVKSVMRMAMHPSNNVIWNKVDSCIRSKVLVGDLVHLQLKSYHGLKV